jgi:lysophospholipase L1-like esterase
MRRLSRSHLLLSLLIVSLSANVLGLSLFAVRTSRKGGMRYLLERLDLRDAPARPMPFQADWQARLRKLPNTEGEIIFAGDSIVAEGPWADLYSPIKNRGIGGETTAGLLARLDEITESHPRKVFLLIGTNCLAADLPLNQVIRNYRAILERIEHDSPRTKIYVLGILPVNQEVPGGPVHDNGTIRECNRRLRALVAEFPGVDFVDVSEGLTDADGNLRPELTKDGLHLTLDAYLIVGARLKDKVLGVDTPGSR